MLSCVGALMLAFTHVTVIDATGAAPKDAQTVVPADFAKLSAQAQKTLLEYVKERGVTFVATLIVGAAAPLLMPR